MKYILLTLALVLSQSGVASAQDAGGLRAELAALKAKVAAMEVQVESIDAPMKAPELGQREILSVPNAAGQWWVSIEDGEGGGDVHTGDIFCRKNTASQIEVYAYAVIEKNRMARWVPVGEWRASFGRKKVRVTKMLEVNPFGASKSAPPSEGFNDSDRVQIQCGVE